MTTASHEAHWPPGVGDYARMRCDHALAEIVDITGRPDDRRYVLNVLKRRAVLPRIARLEELDPIWRATPEPLTAAPPARIDRAHRAPDDAYIGLVASVTQAYAWR